MLFRIREAHQSTEIREHADRLKDSLYGDGMRHCLEIIDEHMIKEKEKIYAEK